VGERDPAAAPPRGGASAIDALLFLMALIWGANYSVLKFAFREVDPQAFNAVRMIVATAAFLAVMAVARAVATDAGRGVLYTPERFTGREWVRLAVVGLIGHFAYQVLFIGGLARTTVANSSLIIAATPAVVALGSALLTHERLGRLHWAGALLSMAGIYVVAGQGAKIGSSQLTGDLMVVVAVVCWAAYTILTEPLMRRHSPVGVTGLSLVFGTLAYVPFTSGRLRATDWAGVSGWTIAALAYAALLSMCVAYTIWYAAVREIGSARTSVYSNLVPILAIVTAALFLEESLGARQLAGAALVVAGVALTRVRPRAAVPMPSGRP
jgi:drug/metabolite transporter (DMT)-like permease